MRCAVYWYDDLDGCTMTRSESGDGASPRSEVAIFCVSAITAVKCKKCSEVMGQCE
jgi:hypothetical protein